MMEEEVMQYRKLYKLYKKLYNFVLLDNTPGWRTWPQCKEGCALAEKRGTELLPLSKRIKIHELAYVSFKKKYPYIKGYNGLMGLFDEEEYFC